MLHTERAGASYFRIVGIDLSPPYFDGGFWVRRKIAGRERWCFSRIKQEMEVLRFG